MNETLTLSKFDVDPTAMNVEREWKLWLLQFEDFVELAIDPGINLLKSYDEAIVKLNEVYIKLKNGIFASGPKAPSTICGLALAKIPAPFLFTNLTANCKPVAVKLVKKDGSKCLKCCQIEHLAKSCPMKTERNVEQSRRSNGGQTFFCYRAEGSKNTCALWLADSGAPQHMTWNKIYFVDFVIFPQPVDVKVRNGDVILAYGWAAVRFEVFAGRKVTEQDGRYLESGHARLCSGIPCTCVFGYGRCYVATVVERLCHHNKRQVQGVLKNHGIKVHAQEEFCTDCVLGKQHRESFHSRKNRSLAPGKLIHVDLCGPMDVAFLGRSKDFAVIKDDFSRYC
ncbi:Retrovirus-related Pol polyprotein from transposon TNT 1-94 [Trichinella zimbabwensis]|uniref:Retrovirus-related Pol polyprotein from transposon TNT 1-94 n=1 Tax=Trichinella zimbabwensis TaxID=268475 RepID=A0A0V1I348_9BILA|nr:Retrovirus-related Pol polyprotein from transposon TNT 1-94 [Trichinella zimbabwensis]